MPLHDFKMDGFLCVCVCERDSPSLITINKTWMKHFANRKKKKQLPFCRLLLDEICKATDHVEHTNSYQPNPVTDCIPIAGDMSPQQSRTSFYVQKKRANHGSDAHVNMLIASNGFKKNTLFTLRIAHRDSMQSINHQVQFK